MTTDHALTSRTPKATRPTSAPHTEALVWIDHTRALIAERRTDGRETMQVIERGSSESEPAFDVRAVRELAGADRIVVSGPAYARTSLERAFVAATHEPERVVDVEPISWSAPRPAA